MTPRTFQMATTQTQKVLRGGVFLVIWLALCTGCVFAQENNGIPPTQNGIPQISAPAWNELARDQQIALTPLKKAWPELTDGQRRKWIAVVKNFSNLSLADQEKIQDRMEDWAALKPAERERARDNFANSKLAAPTNKAGSWEEYQALPQEERNRLAAQAKAKKPRAAKSPKAAPPSQSVPTPNVRDSYPLQPARGELRTFLSPTTLLPLQGQPSK